MSRLRIFDAATFYAIFGRLVGSLSSFVTSFVLLYAVSPVTLGYYLVLASLTKTVSLVDLGMSLAVTQAVSHEYAHAKPDDAEIPDGVVNVMRYALRWYGVGAVTFVIVSWLFGYFYFLHDPGRAEIWPLKWMVTTGVLTANIMIMPLLAAIEGALKVKSVYRYYTLTAIASNIGAWICLFLGVGLWTPVVSTAIALPFSVYMLGVEHGRFVGGILGRLRPSSGAASASPRDSFARFQWRLTISYAANYLSTWAVAPIALKLLGPVDSGRVGIVWTIGVGLFGAATLAVVVRQSVMGRLAALGNYAELDRLVLTSGAVAVGLYLVSSLAFMGCVVVAHFMHWMLVQKLPGNQVIVMILLGFLMTVLTIPMSLYLRAHKSEPLMWAHVGYTMIFCTTLAVFSKWWGTLGFAGAFCLSVVLWLMPYTVIGFIAYRSHFIRQHSLKSGLVT